MPHAGADGGLGPGLWLYQLADWGQVLPLALTLCAVVLVNLLAVLLNMSGVEIAARRDVSENRELRGIGLVNIVVGAFGGTASFMQGGGTIIATRLGVHRAGLVAGHAAVLLVACFLAAQIVAVVPTFVAAGLLMFIGLAMLEDWLIAARKRMIVQDWLIVLGILILTISVGILPAIGAGLGLAMLTFVIGFIRLPVIRSVSSAAIRHSILDRPAAENDLLRRVGDQIRILHLQGPLFFGSVEQLIAHLRRLPEAIAGISGPPRALILDFTEVSTFDSSACAAMQKLGNTMQDRGVAVHLAGMPAQLETMFHRWGLDLAGGMFQVWPSFDVALEVCETRLLAAQPDRPVRPACRGAGDGTGAIVGEVASLLGLPRSADVICQEPARVLCLTHSTIQRLKAEDPDLAALLALILARSLAVKVTQTNALLFRSQARHG